MNKEKPIGRGMTTPSKLRIEIENNLQFGNHKSFTKGQLDAVTDWTIKIIKSAQKMMKRELEGESQNTQNSVRVLNRSKVGEKQ